MYVYIGMCLYMCSLFNAFKFGVEDCFKGGYEFDAIY